MVETEMLSEAPKELSDSIKLIKNSKGYGWELRILCLDIDKLVKLNNRMIDEFGSSGE